MSECLREILRMSENDREFNEYFKKNKKRFIVMILLILLIEDKISSDRLKAILYLYYKLNIIQTFSKKTIKRIWNKFDCKKHTVKIQDVKKNER